MEQKTFDPDGVGVDNGTYFGLPFEPETAELVIVSAPWDVTVSYGAGTAYAPDAIIEASTQLDFHEPLAPGAWRRGIATADVDYSLLDESQRLRGDAAKVIDHLEGGGSPEDDYVVRKICRVNEGCAAMNANIGAQAARWLDAGKLVGLVGGDHSTPYGLIRALGERHAEFGILHIDAHCDLRDAYEGFEFSHASIMFNVLRDVPAVTKIAQVAVRDFSEREAALAASSGRVVLFDDLSLAPSVTFLVMPIFALANAGVEITSLEYLNIFHMSPDIGSVGMGVFFGLLVGKPLGIFLASWGAVKSGLAELPEGATWRMLFAVGCLGGIGFTMSLFVDALAYTEPDLIDRGKIAILMGSTAAAAAGSLLILIFSKKRT